MRRSRDSHEIAGHQAPPVVPESFQIDASVEPRLSCEKCSGRRADRRRRPCRRPPRAAGWTVPGAGTELSDGPRRLRRDDRHSFPFSPPRLVFLESRTGAVTGRYSTCADADDVFFDAKRRRVYVELRRRRRRCVQPRRHRSPDISPASRLRRAHRPRFSRPSWTSCT